MPATKDAITRVADSAQAGNADSAWQLLFVIHEELRAMARARLSRAPPGTRLEPTELVHEAYLRLFDEPSGGHSAAMDRSHSTILREWRFVRALMQAKLEEEYQPE